MLRSLNLAWERLKSLVVAHVPWVCLDKSQEKMSETTRALSNIASGIRSPA
jgi:hypothetical protein